MTMEGDISPLEVRLLFALTPITVTEFLQYL